MIHVLGLNPIKKSDFVRGEGCRLIDENEKSYLDLESGCWCACLGHGHPRIRRVMETQIHDLIHLGTNYPNRLVEEAAAAVLGITGLDDGKCLFLSSGSEAVEFSVQAVRRITGKSYLLTFANSYLAAYGSAGRKSPDEWRLVDWTSSAEEEVLDGLDAISFEDIGGFVFEPGGSGIGFVRFPPKRIVEGIARRIRDTGGLLVANEITTGMGRTGTWFGFQHYDIRPDLTAMGKGLGNGYPVSAIAMTAPVAEKLEKSGLYQAQSHQNDPLGCAVAKEVIAVMREERLVEKSRKSGRYFLEGLKRLKRKYPVIQEARGRGMLLGLAFDPGTPSAAADVYAALLDRGYIVGLKAAGNLLRFDPPLIITREEIDLFLDNLEQAI